MYSTRKKLKMPGKTASHRKSLTRSLVMDLVRVERVKTTPAKAKVLKSQFDKLITAAKKDTNGSRRVIESFFASNEFAIEKLYKLSKRLSDRNSGYTRVIHTLPRKGDNAKQVYVLLVDFEAKEKKSKLQSMIERKEKTDTKKAPRVGRNARNKDEKKTEQVIVKEGSAKTRRISM